LEEGTNLDPDDVDDDEGYEFACDDDNGDDSGDYTENLVVEIKNPQTFKKVRELDALGRGYGTGRRKTSVARVWLRVGSGQILVNDKNFIDYFQPIQRKSVLEPFIETKTAGCYDVMCTVKGGGISGQAGAVRLGISRALEIFNRDLHTPLKRAGYLTRDSRRVERKKPGQKKARKKFQWVKR